MQYPWRSLRDAGFPAAIDLGTADVLVEYDGPQLSLHTVGGRPKYLALASDWDEEGARWIFAEVTRMEVEALALDGLPMRDAFSRKPQLLVVDFDHHGAPMRTWNVAVSNVPRGVLPVVGAPLPDYVREHLIEELGIEPSPLRRVRLDGKPVQDSRIGFSALWQSIQVFQALLTAIGDWIGVNKIAPDTGIASTELLASKFVPASFGVAFEPVDTEAFDKVFAAYKTLLNDAFNNPPALTEALRDHPRLRSSLEDYVDTLETLELDAFIDTPRAKVFLGHRSAPAIVAALKLPLKKKKEAAPTDRKIARVERRGYFTVFNTDREEFSFHDAHAKKTIEGRLSADVAKRVDNKELEAAVGKKTMYVVTLSQPRTGKPKLFELEVLGQIPLGTDRSVKRRKK